MSAPLRAAALALSALLCAGCALTSKSDSVILRYFTPERASLESAATKAPSAPPTANADLELRLGRVDAASYLRDRLVYRNSDYEVGFYDELRWTERPESYLKRALARSLFEEHGIRQMVSGAGLVLEVELDAFEELRAPQHVAHVEIAWMLHGAQAALAQRTLVVDRPLTSDAPDAVAGALADALHEAIARLTTDVVAEMSKAKAAQ